MKEIKAYKCDFCRKVLTTKHNMKKHEKQCFKNPSTKSCASCEHLALENCIDERLTTLQEEKLLNFEIKGTFDTLTGSDGNDFFYLKKEHSYLEENVSVETICLSRKLMLRSLCTNCIYHKPKNNV